MVSIGERILGLRKKLNLSQKELAEKTGITEASLSRYENNLREPKAEIIRRISVALGCSTDYLLGRTNDKKNRIKEINLYRDKTKNSNYTEVEEKIVKGLLDEDIVTEDEPIPEYVFEKILKYGMEAAIEILKLEKKLDK